VLSGIIMADVRSRPRLTVVPPSTASPDTPGTRKVPGQLPGGLRFSRGWLIGAALISGFWIPLRLAFPTMIESSWANTLFDWSLLMLLLIPLLAAWEEFRHLGRGIRWLLALGLAALPLVSVAEPTLGNAATLFYLAKLPLLRGFRDAWALRQRLDALHPGAARLGSVGAILPLMIHLFACGWIGLGSGSAGPHPDSVFEYVRAVYWTITTLATVGYGDIHPQTLAQMIYACLVMLVGVGVFGFILGNIATLLLRLDAERERYLSKVDRAEAFMRHHQIPKSLRAKIRAYYRYLWESRHGYDDRTVLVTLPPILRTKIILALHAELIDRVPFFRGAERQSVEAIVLAFKPRVAVPGEILFRAGDPADALYVIQRGVVDVLTASDTVIATLHDGDFFGEMALLDHAPRNATVRASDYCDLFVLEREAFEPILERYPDFAHHIRTTAAVRKPQPPP
jgi:voltage-gated potassium channel